jgi:hypothetical protein
MGSYCISTLLFLLLVPLLDYIADQVQHFLSVIVLFEKLLHETG